MKMPNNLRLLNDSSGEQRTNLSMRELGEGSNASSTNKELWREENSFLRMRGNSYAQKGVACSKVTLYAEGSSASSTSKELWRAEDSFLRMRRNSDAQKGPACS